MDPLSKSVWPGGSALSPAETIETTRIMRTRAMDELVLELPFFNEVYSYYIVRVTIVNYTDKINLALFV